MPENPSGALPSASGIGSLRWPVTLYQRVQAPDPDTGAIVETLVVVAQTHADVQPSYASTFYETSAVDTPVSHMLFTRWADYVETTNVIMRSTTRPSDGTQRTELFRVRRVKEIAGRKRYAMFECELEAARTTPDDTDESREAAFAEGVYIPS
jgi:head-tail adaptor